MPMVRLPMRKIREVLRLYWVLGLSVRQTSESLGVSTGVISKITNRATMIGLDRNQVQQMGNQELEQRLYGKRVKRGEQRPEPDPRLDPLRAA